jgi:threonine aldolase
MRDAMASAPLGDDVFGDDPSVNQLQDKISALLGFEAALFVPTGTQSNLCAILSHCQRGDEYIVGQFAHCYRWEGGGAAVLGSVQPQPLQHQADGTFRLEDIEEAIKPDDAHFARTRLLALENTLGESCCRLLTCSRQHNWSKARDWRAILTEHGCLMPQRPRPPQPGRMYTRRRGVSPTVLTAYRYV